MVKEVQGGERLIDLEDEDMPFLSEYEQTLTGEGCLFDLRVSWEEGVEFKKSFTIFVINFLHFDGGELRFFTKVKFTMGIDIGLMVPTEGNVNDVWFIFSSKRL